ncbi:MAG TPA: cyanophycin synthetase, partial [Thermoanaerobaculaceae bacterium]|nr:cyanophycin synthetase [Thermoanaerobaculaceae bacterium]
ASEWARVTGVRGTVSGIREPASVAVSGHGPRVTGHGAQAVRFQVGPVQGEAELPLGGEHQLANLALALAGAAALARHGVAGPLDAAALRRGIEGVRWPGRLEWITAGGRALLLDGAHNLEAVAALAAALDRLGLAGRVHLLFSCLADKPLDAMAALLRPRAAGVTVAPIDSPRATPVETLAAAFPGCRVAPSVADALAGLPADRPTLVAGSLRLVGEVKAILGGGDG